MAASTCASSLPSGSSARMTLSSDSVSTTSPRFRPSIRVSKPSYFLDVTVPGSGSRAFRASNAFWFVCFAGFSAPVALNASARSLPTSLVNSSRRSASSPAGVPFLMKMSSTTADACLIRSNGMFLSFASALAICAIVNFFPVPGCSTTSPPTFAAIEAYSATGD